MKDRIYIPDNPHEALGMKGAIRLFALGRFVANQEGVIEKTRHIIDGVSEYRKVVRHLLRPDIYLKVRTEVRERRDPYPEAIECGVAFDSVEMRVRLPYDQLLNERSMPVYDDAFFREIEAPFLSHVRVCASNN